MPLALYRLLLWARPDSLWGWPGVTPAAISAVLVSSAWRGKANMMTMEWHMAMAFEPSLLGRYRALSLLLFALALILAAAPSAYFAEAAGTSAYCRISRWQPSPRSSMPRR